MADNSFPVERLKGQPPSRKTLKDITSRCKRMPENEKLCRSVHARLEYLHDPVAPLDRTASPKVKYVDVLVRFVKLMRRKPLLMRLATSDTTVQMIRELHRDLDVVATELGLDDRVEMQWTEQFAADLAEQYTKLAERVTGSSDRMLVNEVRGDKKLQEALMTLYSGLQTANQTPEMRKLIEATFTRVSNFSQLTGLGMFDWFISLEDVEYEDEAIGIGTFGDVSRGTWLHNGKRQEVVVKRLWEKGDGSSDDPFLNQLEVWGGIPDHPNILKLYGGCHVSSPQFYVCENAIRGNLLDFLAKDENRGLFWRMFRQVAEGLQFLHSQRIVHGGLKCHNILVGDKNVAKLGDFGFSSIRSLSMGLSANSSKVQSEAVRWKPKEMLQEEGNEEPRFESDIYSLGMCMIEAITQALPFGLTDDTDVMEFIMKGGCHPRPDDVEIADETWSLITRLCASDFHDRPTIETVIEEISAFAREEGAQNPVPQGA
ncbi:hypothetical protein BBJ28_00024165 [Nothophytophthora sp. Chile5]|nr:hypothetical protein BBJ28_00024165 [Nothophytophthora sp. Chile5]